MSNLNINSKLKFPQYQHLSIQGARQTQEDTQSKKIWDTRFGPCLHYGIYDGHRNDKISTWLSKNFNTYFMNLLNINAVKDPIKNIISTLAELNYKISNIVKTIFKIGGSTIIAFYYFYDLQMGFVFNLGDSRFICIDKKTQQIAKLPITTYQIQTGKTTLSCVRPAHNLIQCFHNMPILKTDAHELIEGDIYKPHTIYNRYYFCKDPILNQHQMMEWEKLLTNKNVQKPLSRLNKNTYPAGLFWKPTQIKGETVFRNITGNLQPTASCEGANSFHMCSSFGIIDYFPMNHKKYKIFMASDGIEAGEILTPNKIVQSIYDPVVCFTVENLRATRLFTTLKHPWYHDPDNQFVNEIRNGIYENVSVGIIKEWNLFKSPDLTLLQFIGWIQKNIIDNKHFCVVDKRWIDTLRKSFKYIFANMNTSICDTLAHLAIVLGSDDNITIILSDL